MKTHFSLSRFALGFLTLAAIGMAQDITGDTLTLAAQPAAHVYSTTAQAIPNSTATLIDFDSAAFNVGGMFNAGVSTQRLTVQTGGAGLYFCKSEAVIQNGPAAGRRTVQIRKNDVYFATGKQLSGDATYTTSVAASGIVQLAVGDYINMTVQQVSGGTLNTGAAVNQTFLQCVKLH